MNKPKHQMTNRAKKKMSKEIRSSAIQPEPLLTNNNIKPDKLLSRYPKKIQKQEKASLKSFEKNIAIIKKKKKARHSKRTTPGTVDQVSPPQIIHIEGKRWIKTLEKQVQAKKKIMRRHILKKKGR